MEEGIKIPPPTAPLLALFVAWVAHLRVPDLAVEPAGWLLVAAGAAVMIMAFLEQSKAGTNPEPHKATTALVTRGVYAYTRNPIYVGFLLLQAGIGFWTGWWVAAALVPVSAFALWKLAIQKEEAYLLQRFGDAYEEYCRNVRRWM